MHQTMQRIKDSFTGATAMSKQVTVRLAMEWTFDQRDWSAEKKHIEELKNNTKVVLEFDTIHSLHMLNDLDYPKLKECKVTSA